uniref:hypothetical protein n=1 Tax=Clostridium sp. NkU-1 TaxID=1095009 RepID=UPI000AA9F420
MMGLLVFKERLKEFYARFEIYITPVIKFIFSLLAFALMNKNIGFMSKLTAGYIPLVLALVCSFLPYGAISFLAASFMLVHLSGISIEITLVMAVFILVVGLLYYGFQPGDSYLLVLTPVFFSFKNPLCDPADRRAVRERCVCDTGKLRCIYLLCAFICKAECRSPDQ